MKKAKRERKNEIDMLHGPLFKKMVLFALPLAASSILQQLFNLADTAIVGRFAGSEAMAAVGGNVPIINLLVSLFVGISIGANVVIGRFIGEGKQERISDAVHTVILLAFISGILLMAVGLAASGALLRITGVPDNVMGLARLYLRIYFFATPFILIFNYAAAILRSKGDSRRPLYILMAAGVINVGLNLLFVIVFNMSVAGVALATLISNCISCIIVLILLTKEDAPFRLNLKALRLNGKIVKEVLRIGIPAGLQGVVFSFSNTIIQSGINSLGSDVIAGNAAAVNFESICYFAINSFNQTCVTFTSQNYGAGNARRCNKVFLESLAAGMVFCCVLNEGFALFHEPLLALFTTETAVLAVGRIRMLHVLTVQWIAGSYEIAGSALRGMGYSLTPTLITIFGTCVLRILWVYAVFPRHRTYEMLLLTYPITWVVTGIAVLVVYFIIRKKAYAGFAAK